MIFLSSHHLQSTKTESVLFVLFALFTDSNDFDSYPTTCSYALCVRVYVVSWVGAKLHERIRTFVNQNKTLALHDCPIMAPTGGPETSEEAE